MSHARRPYVVSLLAIALALVLSACVGGQHSGKTINGHHCTKADNALQCVLPPAPKGLKLPRASSLYGVDFAWGGPRSCGQMRSLGARFGASYLSYDSSKNWNGGLVQAFHSCGIGTVAVWETTANRATQGFNAGWSDAREASRQAAALGNTDRPIDFAVDCDCAGSSILGYFQGAHSVLGNRTNAYGGYYQVRYLSNAGVVGHENWQTYAWSGGNWLPASVAPLQQYLNGGSYDNDRAIAANYGQWPAAGPPPPPPPPPDPLAILDKTVRHFGKVSASEHGSVATWDKAKCKSPAKRPVCKSSYYHMRLLHERLYWIAFHVKKEHPVSFGTDFPNWTNGKGARFRIIGKRLK